MKAIVVLIALTCLFGLVGAQTISGPGEGYSSSQLACYNEITASTFASNVDSYWGEYVAKQGNEGLKSTSSDTDIWMNTFPLKFSNTLKLNTTSFNANASAPVLNSTQKNSQSLTRAIYFDFDINRDDFPVQTSGSVTAYNGTGSPSEDAPGKIMSQNIMVLFN